MGSRSHGLETVLRDDGATLERGMPPHHSIACQCLFPLWDDLTRPSLAVGCARARARANRRGRPPPPRLQGQPDVATRMFLKRLKCELNIPVLGFVDADPYGASLSHRTIASSSRMATPGHHCRGDVWQDLSGTRTSYACASATRPMRARR